MRLAATRNLLKFWGFVLVICAGGGGIPTTFVPDKERTLGGVEAVIDKDLASELLARELESHHYIMATDVDGVYDGWGTPDEKRLEWVTAEDVSEALVRVFGDPGGGDAARLTQDALRSLAEMALVEIENGSA